ncbi:class I SAM-dependent methyltransferase [Paenibacillus sp. JNUCC31]|uniref:class I SAM-dependent methyltransferase n=1 Tax=Paenibacillus sp. JNUCC-31 TaxID=2777983 RepID=UPI00178435AD|nr:class I SAM-dependent methyltransferase [Paenibacillus sp. JNUCC-31]QOS80431.1 class I SAM-dependent methyltransferase [Paenibacillus sp. JNUCC-31]
MSSQGSYQISTIASNIDKEINRLKAQVDLFWDKEFKRYVEFGLEDGMKIAELGSGPGFVTENLLKTLPNIHITALEIDSILVEYAAQYLKENQFDRYEIVQGSIMTTGFPDNSFDFAITRLVLEHLPDPVGAVREICRIIKPGGKAIFVDNDFEMHIMTFPSFGSLRELYEAYCQSRSQEGGNPKIGRELPLILKRGGLSNIDFEVISAHSEVVGDEKFFKSEGIGIPSKLVRDGFLPSKVLADISVQWRNVVKSEDHAILRQLYMAVGEKMSVGEV